MSAFIEQGYSSAIQGTQQMKMIAEATRMLRLLNERRSFSRGFLLSAKHSIRFMFRNTTKHKSELARKMAHVLAARRSIRVSGFAKRFISRNPTAWMLIADVSANVRPTVTEHAMSRVRFISRRRQSGAPRVLLGRRDRLRARHSARD